ncbi:MAG: exo-alpha-sialidase [Rubripirellula sp.]|nr:exo-alpha-sialidase [Rubripirellula sp.]
MLRHLLLTTAFITLIAPCEGQESEWKLQALKYNHNELVVDLGVGLWAWPMPLDYDSDGDIDLLVACPDKPSNGVFFFENPTQDASNPNPVFLPAVRIGSAGHNYQVSYVEGHPRILKPGYEFPRDITTGEFKFSEPQKIYARSNIHANGVRGNMWRYVDYEGDGDQDIIVGVGDWSDYGWDHAYDSNGDWNNGPLHGFIYLIRNQGTDTNPNYSVNAERLKAGGADLDVYGWPSPNFGDFDNDGDLDLICGEFLDGFTYFKNEGNRESPRYAAGIKLSQQNGLPLVMDLQMITPTAFDWDSDGDLDLIVGDEDGRVALVENTGTFDANKIPTFKTPHYFKQQADTLKFGALATPFAYDWDQDGDEDILCGNTAGHIGWFENLGTNPEGDISWAAPTYLLKKNTRPTESSRSDEVFRILAGETGSIQGPCEAKWGYTTFSVADWNHDGKAEILYNSIHAKLGLLTQDGLDVVEKPFDFGVSEQPPQWSWWRGTGADSLTQWRTTPFAIDFDGDQEIEIISLDQEGYLTLREKDRPGQRIFCDELGNNIQLNKKSCGASGRIKLTVADWDNDGRLDVIVNSENALWYRNCETRNGKHVLKKIGNLAVRNVAGHTSSPAVCDFNQDGKLDLLVGAENGRIYHIKHEDCVQYSEEQLRAQKPTNLSPNKFPGFESEDFVFTKASFPQCHASSICETSRGLAVAWFGGTKEKDKDVGIWVSYHDGSGWSSPKEWANGVQHSQLRYPCWNPVLYQPKGGNQPLLLFFKVGPDPRSWWGEMMLSYDRGRTFRDRSRLPESIDGPVRCKPIELADGTLLAGSSTEYDGWRVHFEKTKLDNGLPSGIWSRIGPINTKEEFNAIQPTILRLRDGRLQALCRTQEGVISTTYSEDDGQTWSKMSATNLPNPNSGIDAVSLQDGRQLLIYNHLGSGSSGWGRRGLLNLAISEDGLEWKKVATLEQEANAEFSYPAIIQAEDGKVHISYTWKRQRIKHVTVNPNQIQAGDILSLDDWDSKEQ